MTFVIGVPLAVAFVGALIYALVNGKAGMLGLGMWVAGLTGCLVHLR